MIQAASLDELQLLLTSSPKVSKKALEKMPKVTVVEFGKYIVEGSTKSYEAYAGRTYTGAFFIACTCRAGLEGLTCYHCQNIFDTHVKLAVELKKAKRQAENKAIDESPYLKKDSEQTTTKIGGYRI